jgi:hypothetical protein
MSTTQDCPICMEMLVFNKNCITTDCGHCFHAKCLMTSVAHNGFACPCCRTAMAETVGDEDEDDEDDEDDWSDVSEDEMFGDYVLRGLRFFNNNIAGIEHDADDIAEEDAEEEEDSEPEEPEEPKASVAFITQKLFQQGITVEKLVRALLTSQAEYAEERVNQHADDEIFGKMRAIINNYDPQQEVAVVTNRIVCDNSAQPKIANRISL